MALLTSYWTTPKLFPLIVTTNFPSVLPKTIKKTFKKYLITKFKMKIIPEAGEMLLTVGEL